MSKLDQMFKKDTRNVVITHIAYDDDRVICMTPFLADTVYTDWMVGVSDKLELVDVDGDRYAFRRDQIRAVYVIQPQEVPAELRALAEEMKDVLRRNRN